MSANRRSGPGDLEARVEARIAAGDVELPVFPSSAQEVMTLCEAEDVDPKKLSNVIRRDPTLAGHFLALANSAAFGARVQLVSLQQALTRLGIVQTKQIAMVIACKTRAFVVPSRPRRGGEILAHALDTALVAQEVARLRRMNVEEAFLGGLLHDIGRPAVLQICAEDGGDAEDAEVVASRMHERVGALIATHWCLPRSIASVIGAHHLAENASEAVAIVQLADAIVDGDDLTAHPAANILNLYPEDVSALVAKREKMRSAA